MTFPGSVNLLPHPFEACLELSLPSAMSQPFEQSSHGHGVYH